MEKHAGRAMQRFMHTPPGRILVGILVCALFLQGWPVWRVRSSTASSAAPTTTLAVQQPAAPADNRVAAQVTACPRNGDVDDDKELTPTDVLMTFQHFLRLTTLTPCEQERANVHQPTNPAITPADAACIFRRFSGLPSCLDNLNTPPVADAGPDQTVREGATVTLDGRASSDAEDNALRFIWTLAALPEGSAATLLDPTLPQPTFAADLPGIYTARLVVNDGAEDSLPDSVTITVQAASQVDTDGDGLIDSSEGIIGTNPTQADSDGDGVSDGDEIARGTNPLNPDSDGDGVSDGDEINVHGTDPLVVDSDGDGVADNVEIAAGSNPLDPTSLPLPESELTRLEETSPANGEGEVAVTRETILSFSQALAAATAVDEPVVFAEFAGQRLLTRHHIAADRRTVTLFYEEPLPASARIRVTVLGDTLLDERGQAVDVDDDGVAGGIAVIEFDTLSLTSVPDTVAFGRVFASELDSGDNGMPVNIPLEGVTITVDGQEDTLWAVTDQLGSFRLENAPVGMFFVHIDGRTATNGVLEGGYYPFIGKAWRTEAGQETNVGNVYLPLVQPGSLQPVSSTEETTITFVPSVLAEFPELTGVQVVVPPGSLFADDGMLGGMVGIAPVPPDRLPGALPEGLRFPLVITVQTDGATNFDEPVAVCFPNLPDPVSGETLAPGAPSALWSFNHDIGRFEIVGSMTVSADGRLVCSDPGQGIRAPGWHGTQPGVGVNGGEIVGVGPNRVEQLAYEKGTEATPMASPYCPQPCEKQDKGPVDPVYLFSGEFYEEIVDLRIRGRELDFVWARKYRSQAGPNTSQGHSWDFSYNIRIAQQGEDILVFDGNSRGDLYRLQADGTWSRPEFFRSLVRNADATYSLIFEDTGRWNFRAFTGAPADGKLASIVDRNGNRLRFAYDEQGRLTTITDSLDRDIVVAYNAAGLLASITDFAGRVVRYGYYDGVEAGGNVGDLKSVTSPSVTGTPNGNDFPNGKTITYTYSTGFADERLNHNLLTITDGRRNDPSDPTSGSGPYLVNIYADTTDPSNLNFDRAVRQLWGGDTIDMVYVPQTPTPENGQAILKTIVNDRVGNVKEYAWDNRNRAVSEREYTGHANPLSPTTEVSNRPTGQLRADDPPFFETRYEWNDDALMTRIVHPNGDVTEYVYEADLNPIAPPRTRHNMRIMRHRPGSHTPAGDQPFIQETFEYHPEFASYGGGKQFVTRHTDARGNVTVHDYDTRGNRMHTQHRLASIEENFTYNEFGQLTSLTHPDNGSGSRRQDVFVYYTHAEDDDQEGYVKQRIIDANGEALTATFAYDLVGNVIRATDHRGHDTQYVVNALNQVVRTTSRAVGDGSEVRYQVDVLYDANNNGSSQDVQNIDESGALQPNTHFTTTYDYEILDNMTRMTEEVGEEKIIVTEYAYDGNRNRTLVRFGEATNGNQPANTVRMLYDERDLKFQEIIAPGDASQSTTQYDYDHNKNLVARHAGLEDTPRLSRMVYDGYNRPVSMTDPMGNVMTYTYDPNHNRIRKEIRGELVDAPGTGNNVRLREAQFIYDEMDREIRREVAFFDTDTQSSVATGTVFGSTFYSASSQVVRLVDDNGHQALMSYDTVNRPSILTDHRGNTNTYRYDANSNMVQMVEVEKSDLENPDETFVTTYTYDNLDRLVRQVDNDADTHEYSYDSRHNLTLMVDALRPDNPNDPGNLTRYAYDGINRLISTTHLLTDNGMGTGTPAGAITMMQRWDDSSRLVAQSDDNDNATTYAYDALNRLRTMTHADATAHTSGYDVHHNVVAMTDANGNQVATAYDLRNRPSSRTITPGAGVSSDTTFERYAYDGLSRLVQAEDDDSLVTRSYDSLSRMTRETLNGQTTTLLYDGVGNQLVTTYPGGRQITMGYDVLDRIQTIADQNGAIANYAFIGRQRMERREYANNTNSTWQYDNVKRIVGTTHRFDPNGAATVFDERAYTWDRMDNKTSRRNRLPGGLQHTYDYDSVYRMTRSLKTLPDNTSAATSYSLDGVGNRTEVTGGSQPGSYTLAPELPEPGDRQSNQYTTTPVDQRLYDQNGNLSRINAESTTERQFAYDYRNQMVQHMDQGTATTAHYRYDALGRRIERVVDNGQAVTTRYFYDRWRVVEEQDEDNATQATYVYGRYIDEVLSMRRNGVDVFYHTDDLYNVVKVTDAAGNVVEQYEYDDFGAPSVFGPTGVPRERSAIGNPYLSNGRRFDPETDFYYYRTRYLEPQSGRFTTRDTIGIWGDLKNLGNGYTYVANNPLTSTDPFGESAESQLYGQERKQGRGLICYNPKEKYYHRYEMEEEICSITDKGCTQKRVWEALKHYAVPGQDSSKEVYSGSETNIKLLGITGGSVTHIVYDTNMTLYNITNPGHIFDDGWVERSIIIRDGNIYVRTIGEGINNKIIMGVDVSKEARKLNLSTYKPAFFLSDLGIKSYVFKEALRDKIEDAKEYVKDNIKNMFD